MRSIYLLFFSISNLLFIVAIQLVTLIKVGPSSATDALFAGMTIPSVALAVLIGSLNNYLVPQFVTSKYVKKKMWGQSYVFFLGTTAFLLPFVASCHWWLGAVFSGFDSKTLHLTYQIIIIQFLVMPFTIVSAIYTAYFNSQSRFICAEAIPAACSIVIIPFVFVTIPTYGVLSVSYLYAAKILLSFLVQSLFVGKPIKVNKNELDIMKTIHGIKYLMLGSIYYKSGPVIDRHILSHTTSGTMSLFVLVQQLLSMGNLILTKVIVIPQITVMNQVIGNGDSIFRRWLARRVLLLLTIVLALFISFCSVGGFILTLVCDYFSLTKFDPHVIWLLGITLFGTLIGDFVSTLISSSFYSRGDTKTPSLLSILTFTIFIPVKFIAFYFSGVYGLAMASSAYSLINMMALYKIIMVKLK